MRDYLRLTGILLIVCIIAAGLLGVTNAITSEKIEEQIVRANDEARREVLSAATEFSKVNENEIDEIINKSEYDIISEIYEGKTRGDYRLYCKNFSKDMAVPWK